MTDLSAFAMKSIDNLSTFFLVFLYMFQLPCSGNEAMDPQDIKTPVFRGHQFSIMVNGEDSINRYGKAFLTA